MTIWSLAAPDSDQEDAFGPSPYPWLEFEDAAASPDPLSSLLVAVPQAAVPFQADLLLPPGRRAFRPLPWRFAPFDLTCGPAASPPSSSAPLSSSSPASTAGGATSPFEPGGLTDLVDADVLAAAWTVDLDWTLAHLRHRPLRQSPCSAPVVTIHPGLERRAQAWHRLFSPFFTGYRRMSCRAAAI